VVLREMRTSDAASLFALLTTEEVARFISPPPSSVEGFERFIDWAARQRAAGQYACFAVTTVDSDTAIGIFQVRSLEPGFGTAEWCFAICSPFWGIGVFLDGAKLVVEFAFDTIGASPARSPGRHQEPRQRRAPQAGRGSGRRVGSRSAHRRISRSVAVDDSRRRLADQVIWGGGKMILH
jgi:hypothetical protein